jgi:hypothetical protein
LFNIRTSTHFDPERLADEPLERRGVTAGRPELELRIALCPHSQQRIILPIVQLDVTDRLGMAAVEALGEAQDGGKRPHDPASFAGDFLQHRVPPLWRRAPVVPRDKGNRVDFVRLETTEVAVFDQVIRMLMVPFVADMDADVVQQRGVLEPLALVVGERVCAACELEQRHREPRDLIGMLRPVVAPLRELDDASPAHVGIAIRLHNLLAVPRDVVENQTLPQ